MLKTKFNHIDQLELKKVLPIAIRRKLYSEANPL